MKTTVAFFAHERGDARVRKRIAGLQEQGMEVVGYTFHRVRDKEDVDPTWENFHLGTTYNRRYFHRLWVFATCIGILWKQRRRLAECGVMYVVNTDNAMLAILGSLFAGRRIPLVLELADVQPVMVGDRLVSKILRWVERRVLDRSSLLVTTSPGFVKHFFQPVQGFDGDIFLLENKVYPSDGLPPADTERSGPMQDGRPWIVGCFGAFRCRRSMQLMHALAERLGPEKLRFVLRGYPSGTIVADFPELLGDLPNMRLEGAYQYPDDLAGMYGAIDFNWAFDETDPNGNSTWLLPNRIYEGGCFASPVITAKATETGEWVEQRELGWTFAEPLEENLAAFFEKVTPDEWKTVRGKCVARPRSEFTGEEDLRRLSEILSGLAAEA